MKPDNIGSMPFVFIINGMEILFIQANFKKNFSTAHNCCKRIIF